MVEDVERFQTEVKCQAFVDREDSRELGIYVVGGNTAEGVSADSAEGSNSGACERGDGGGASGGDLRERCGVEVLAISLACGLEEGDPLIDGNAGYKVRAVLTVGGEGVVDAGGDVEGCAAEDLNLGSEFPVVDQESGEPGDPEFALRDNDDVLDVPVVRTAGAVVPGRIVRVLNADTGDIAVRVGLVEALGPCPVCEQAEGSGETVLDGGYQAVVVSCGEVSYKDRAAATAEVLVALGGIGDGEPVARRCIGDRGAGGSCSPGLDRRRTGGDDTGATCATCSPNAGDEDRVVERIANGSVAGAVADVIQLQLPATSQLPLNAGGVLDGVGRVEVRRQDDVLSLCGEDRTSLCRDHGLGEGVVVDAVDEPRTCKTQLAGGWGADRGGEGRILVDALGREVVWLVVNELCTCANDGLAIAKRIEGSTDVGGELPGRILGKLPGDARVSIERRSGGSPWKDGADLVGQECGVVEGGSAVEEIGRHKCGRPANASYQSEPLGGVVGILHVEAGNGTAQSVLLLFALLEATHRTFEQVQVGIARAGIAGCAAAVDSGEGEVAVGLEAPHDVELIANILAADDDLMLAADHGELVRERQRVVVIVAGGAGSAVRGEFAGDGGLEAGRQSAVNVDAQRAGVDSGGRRAHIDAAGDGDVRRVYGAGVDGVILSDGPGLDALIVSRSKRGEKDVGRREEAGCLVAVEEVAAIQVVFLVDGVVHAGNELLVKDLRGHDHVDYAAVVGVLRGVDCREIFLQGERLRAPCRRGGVLVTGNQRAGQRIVKLKELAVCCAAGTIGSGEVSGEVSGRGYAVSGWGCALLGLMELISGEEEKLVSTVVQLGNDDGSAEGSAILMLMKGVLLGIEKVGGVDVRIAGEVEAGAVDHVATSACDDVDQAAGVHTGLRAKRRRFDAELADCVRERKGQVPATHVVIVVAAIEAPLGGIAVAASD